MNQNKYSLLLLFLAFNITNAFSQFKAFDIYDYISLSDQQLLEIQQIQQSQENLATDFSIDADLSPVLKSLRQQTLPYKHIFTKRQKRKILRVFRKILRDEKESKFNLLRNELI